METNDVLTFDVSRDVDEKLCAKSTSTGNYLAAGDSG
jgi:hypothetical protein